MKIPGRNLSGWAKEIIDQCSASRNARISRYRNWTNIYYTGAEGDVPSKHNRCYSHVDKLSSYLFSPSEVRYDIDFDGSTTEEWKARVAKSSNYLNRQFMRSGSDITFGQGNEWSLVKGCAILKQVWGRSGFEPWVIQPEFFGVLQENVEDLDRQEAFTHTFFITEDQFRRMVINHPSRSELMDKVAGSFASEAEAMMDNSRHDLMVGGGWNSVPTGIPGITTNQATTYGTVDWTTRQAGPELSPYVLNHLIRVEDLWVWDDDKGDWTTIRWAEPGVVIEGELIHRNLGDAGKGEHPFVKICSNKVPNYFWGRSEISNIWPNQKMLTSRLNNIDSIFSMQAKPSRVATGSAAITDERLRALLTPGATLTDASPTGKVESFAPEMPQGALEYLEYLDSCFDEAAGFTKMLQGEGEAGVRAGVHANTLLRTSSPRLRDRALIVEKQAANWGDLCLKMLRMKDPTVMKCDDGSELTLDQLPTDASVMVDSHSSSPAFSGDNQQLMFALNRAGAVGPDQLLQGVQPPRLEQLLAALRESQASQAAMMEELKQKDPEQWAKAVGGSGHR